MLVALFFGAPGCAHRAGGRATQGALEALRAPPPEDEPHAAEVLGRFAVEGALNELTSEDGSDKLRRLIDATTRDFFAVALGPPAIAARTGGSATTDTVGGGGSYVAQLSHVSAAAFGAAVSAEIRRQLGQDGNGPLARSIGATAGRVSGSVVNGIDEELTAMFPGCNGIARGACLQAVARDLGAAASEGFVDGLLRAAAWRILVLAFVLGVVAALAGQATWALLRRAWRGPPARREART
jgi:hypothetical protein